MAIPITENDFTSFDVSKFYLYLLDKDKQPLTDDESEELIFLLADRIYVSASIITHYKYLSEVILLYRKANLSERKVLQIILEALYFIGRYDIMKQCGVKKLSDSWKKNYENFPFGNYLWRKKVLLYKIYEQLSDNEINAVQRRLSLLYTETLTPAVGAQPNSLLMNILLLEQEFSLRADTYENNIIELVRNMVQCSPFGKQVYKQYKDYCTKLENGEVIEPVRENRHLIENNPELHRQISDNEEEVPTSIVTGDIHVAPLFGSQPMMTNSITFYKIESDPKGLCYIFNNEDYSTLAKRTGTTEDCKRIESLFKSLHFDVRLFQNMTAKQMFYWLSKLSQSHTILTKHDMFVCFILSHGTLAHVTGVDGQDISIYTLTSLFNSENCSGLRNKPKSFFIQACQGDKAPKACIQDNIPFATPEAERNQGGAAAPLIQQVSRDTNEQQSADWAVKEAIPTEADFLFGMSTFRGYRSYRSKSKGSFYIRKLCDLIEKHYEECDILHILTLVNNSMCDDPFRLNDECYIQVPSPAYTLRKLLYFCYTAKFNTNPRTST